MKEEKTISRLCTIPACSEICWLITVFRHMKIQLMLFCTQGKHHLRAISRITKLILSTSGPRLVELSTTTSYSRNLIYNSKSVKH